MEAGGRAIGGHDACSLDKDEGSGDAQVESFYYGGGGECHKFTYKGEGGNDNRRVLDRGRGGGKKGRTNERRRGSRQWGRCVCGEWERGTARAVEGER